LLGLSKQLWKKAAQRFAFFHQLRQFPQRVPASMKCGVGLTENPRITPIPEIDREVDRRL